MSVTNIYMCTFNLQKSADVFGFSSQILNYSVNVNCSDCRLSNDCI